MSTVLHPVGPEPEETYWARRVAVIIALVVVAGLVVALVVNATRSGSAVSAEPVPPAVTAPPADSPSPSPSASTSASASPSPSASASASAKASPSSKPSASASAKPKATPSPKPTPTGPVACPAEDLRATLTGKQRLKPGQKTTFTLSLINGSATTCVVSVTPKTFELKIYSGTDRIWSSDDCAAAVKPRKATVKAEDALEWTMGWGGDRSRAGCKSRPEVPRPGTYFATAQLDGAKPVQLRMILGG